MMDKLMAIIEIVLVYIPAILFWVLLAIALTKKDPNKKHHEDDCK